MTLNCNGVLSVSSFVYVAERWVSVITMFNFLLKIHRIILYLNLPFWHKTIDAIFTEM